MSRFCDAKIMTFWSSSFTLLAESSGIIRSDSTGINLLMRRARGKLERSFVRFIRCQQVINGEWRLQHEHVLVRFLGFLEHTDEDVNVVPGNAIETCMVRSSFVEEIINKTANREEVVDIIDIVFEQQVWRRIPKVNAQKRRQPRVQRINILLLDLVFHHLNKLHPRYFPIEVLRNKDRARSQVHVDSVDALVEKLESRSYLQKPFGDDDFVQIGLVERRKIVNHILFAVLVYHADQKILDLVKRVVLGPRLGHKKPVHHLKIKQVEQLQDADCLALEIGHDGAVELQVHIEAGAELWQHVQNGPNVHGLASYIVEREHQMGQLVEQRAQTDLSGQQHLLERDQHAWMDAVSRLHRCAGPLFAHRAPLLAGYLAGQDQGVDEGDHKTGAILVLHEDVVHVVLAQPVAPIDSFCAEFEVVHKEGLF
ncbi:hypothetical protein OGATHE_001578 [Ogataea polymorpha]|uniref:Uncharacterized protein n=1 Tax=Ogataea polymorpha TaxID=460523 RepID=A0A9P8PMW4_9ASCO|nr:hypothetical protein OGATHE_001578 [Ogataea polymorpha]